MTADNRRPSSRKPSRRRAVRPTGAPPPPAGSSRRRGPRAAALSPSPPTRRTARGRLEAFSARPLLVMNGLPRWLVPVVLAILLVAGLAISGPVGAILLLVLGVFLAWLVFLSWPVLPGTTRIIRVVVVVGILGVAVVQATR